MSELIKREDAIKITWQEPQYYDPINALTEVREKIRALPTVDAVPVVRCKECKWWKKYRTDNDWGLCEKHDIDHPCNCDWFCADGERRTE